ncbi:beta-lactamase family protein [Hymenobacter sp. BT175]|uniref:serine hydrolase domain-containing protein n=1 Tax=Hymenobacter translucens TaxID=2886507 RepID=UPI001D0EF6B4|nr:serine hydrolase domain-containing protein [Hymenobacter translucens]MCC2545491.1 beta-lactamase family protein [Hymenobacter translucens]
MLRSLLFCAVLIGGPGPVAPPHAPGPTDLPRRLEAALAGTDFAGVVLVGRGDSLVWQRGYGQADRERHIRNTASTAYDIGSLTKQFTAAAVLALEQDGKLSVQDSLGQYFPAAPADKRGITLHQLLTHTAGLREYSGRDEQWLSRKDFIRQTLRRKLVFAPGSAYQYSNVGYSLLAVIIEQVSGQPYEQYLNRRLFQPAGLTSTGYRLVNWPDSAIAVGYVNGRPWGKPNSKGWAPDGPSWNLRGNGGVLSTAQDMWLWHRALTTGQVLTPVTLAKLYQPYVAKTPNGSISYGYGWSVYQSKRGTPVVSHGGSNGVFFAHFVRYLDPRDGPTVLFVVTNQSQDVVRKVSQDLMAVLFPG